MGGMLELVAQFPNRPPVVIDHLAPTNSYDHAQRSNADAEFQLIGLLRPSNWQFLNSISGASPRRLWPSNPSPQPLRELVDWPLEWMAAFGSVDLQRRDFEHGSVTTPTNSLP